MPSSSWSPYWGTELDLLELGMRFERGCTDEASPLEHRLARANGQQYGCPPRHWSWEREKYAAIDCLEVIDQFATACAQHPEARITVS